MGLEFTGYQKVAFVSPDEPSVASGAEAEGWVLFRKAADLPDRSDGMPEGWYMPFGEKWSSDNTSYKGYNQWRRLMAAMLDIDLQKLWRSDDTSGPFIELLNYSDAEGFFGPKTCAKLARDFKRYAADAASTAKKLKGDDRDLFTRIYQDMSKAFTLASRGGAVRFH